MRYNFALRLPLQPPVPQRRHRRRYENYRARRGVNPGNNVNDPSDDRELRLPDRQELNLQARLSLLPLIGQQLDFYVDALNILDLRTPTGLRRRTTARTSASRPAGWRPSGCASG